MIAVCIGITGNLGRELVRENLRRGHVLRGIAPTGSVADLDPAAELSHGAAGDRDLLCRVFRGADVILPVFPPALDDPWRYPEDIRTVLDCAKAAGVPRVVALLGSSGAKVSTGERLVETDYFQETTRHFYLNIHDSWDIFRREKELDWTVVVPAARMQVHMASHGGRYRTRTDEYLVTTDEASRQYFEVSQISYADCACAMWDEVEQHRHSGRFVTVGY